VLVAERNLLSYFWAPLCAVGAHDATGRMNAQITVSVFGAGIVPDRPRLLIVTYKHNYTHDLMRGSGTASVNLLAVGQEELLVTLGMQSGREVDKLAGLAVRRSALGNPVLEDGLGCLDCRVIDGYDLGDATAFLCGVEENVRLRKGEPLVWQEVRPGLPEEWLRKWEAKIGADIERARAVMRW
jgi:flavin reductase (DIM6/NTAB) family NADH-FMN oxidoreductase RutF